VKVGGEKLVLGKLVGKIKEKIREERIARKAEKKLKKLEERRKIEMEKKKLIKAGLDPDEAEILAKKRIKSKEKGRSVLDNLTDMALGSSGSGRSSGSKRSKKSSSSKSSSKKKGKGRNKGGQRPRNPMSDIDGFLKDLDRATRIF